MKKSIFFKQKKPLTVWMLGGLMLILVVWILATEAAPLNQIVIMGALAMILLGYSISYEFTEDYNNHRHYKFLGVSLFKSKLKVMYPEYITVFAAKFKQGSDWGPIGALGNDRKEGAFVLRLFKDNRHFTVYRTQSRQLAEDRAFKLSELLGVEIRGKN